MTPFEKLEVLKDYMSYVVDFKILKTNTETELPSITYSKNGFYIWQNHPSLLQPITFEDYLEHIKRNKEQELLTKQTRANGK